MSLTARSADDVGADDQEHAEYDKGDEGVDHVPGGGLVVLIRIAHFGCPLQQLVNVVYIAEADAKLPPRKNDSNYQTLSLDYPAEYILRVTLNRPEVYKACHPPASQELSEVFEDFDANPDLWVAIVTGAGDKAFCAGNDLTYHAEMRAKTGKRPDHGARGFGGITKRYDMVKPVIAAVNGVAMGGGFEIALACDIIIASDKARFALPEPRVGLTAGAAGMQRLSRSIPL